MRYLGRFSSVVILGLSLQVACRDNQPSVPRVAVPEVGRDTRRTEADYTKPLPEDAWSAPAAAPAGAPGTYEDEPLVVDPPPEAKTFVDVYRRVGTPRIVVFVNRTLEGQILPSTPPGPDQVTERVQKSNTAVNVERREYEQSKDREGSRTRDKQDRFSSQGPAEYTETTTVYLKPGQYDEVDARAIDYGMMENLLADWMSADNQVTIVSPMMVRRQLNPEQIKALEGGRQQALSDVARQLDADVLIQAQARPTRQTREGLEIRVIAEAIDIRTGNSLARGAVDVYPPLEKTQTNKFTRFLARKLMDGMTQTWSQPTRAARTERDEGVGATTPPPQNATAPTTPPVTNGGAPKGLGPRRDAPADGQ